MELKKEKSKLILHTCCAICAVGLVDALQDSFSVTLFFYNPNIQPMAEYEKRKEAVVILAKRYNLELIEGDYRPKDWLKLVVGLEGEPEGGKRCLVCFRDRLLRTAEFAKDNQADNFTTTLLASHLKNEQVIKEIGQRVAKENVLNFLNLLDLDYQKSFNRLKTKQTAQELGLYKQKYCGCLFSFRG
ncbi:MAG: epoxyqueuosine reductase QueH [Candidatus Pacebacteria bacterium]|nr:epoxyqueuosine reductase QueH [Candidatus Paceibacterota bacterium]